MNNVKELVKTVGMGIFVEYYTEFKEVFLHEDDLGKKHKLADKLLSENPNADSYDGQITRINAAIRLFKNGLHIEALEKVIESNHFKITSKMKEKAKNILLNQ